MTRVARGGEVLAPGRPRRFVQIIDVRDLSEWIVSMVERKETGIYNAAGLPQKPTMERLLEDCRTVSGSDAHFTWVGDDFLNRERVRAWTEMPLWLPENLSELGGFFSVSVDKARSYGLTLRPLGETIQEVLTWSESNRPHQSLQAGIDFDRERELLGKWREQQ